MNIKNYSTLKSASKVVFSKDGDDVKLTEKQFDPSTGSTLSDKVKVVDLDWYESEKLRLESENSNLESLITELGKIITDIKAL